MIFNTKSGCQITGPLIRDPEFRDTGKGTVVKFAVRYDFEEAVGENGRRAGKILDVDAWGELGDSLIGMGVHKGDCVQVTGEIQTREYNGKTYRTLRADAVLLDVRVLHRMLFAGQPLYPGETLSAYSNEAHQASRQDDFVVVENNDDLPF